MSAVTHDQAFLHVYTRAVLHARLGVAYTAGTSVVTKLAAPTSKEQYIFINKRASEGKRCHFQLLHFQALHVCKDLWRGGD